MTATNPPRVSDDEGKETVLYSRLNGPIAELSLLRKSLLFAELSCVAYMPRADAGRLACEIGLPNTHFYDRDGAQAYIFSNHRDAVVACRGTEPTEWNDIQADLNAVAVVGEAVGRVHSGFKREVDDLWPRLEQALITNRKPLWFAGHSLGGAMAAICAGRCKLSYIESNPQALFTYGSPRVGNNRYVNHVRMDYYRWVNNNDIVPRVPPCWLGYRHAGIEMYLDRRGRLRKMTGYRRLRDRWWGFVHGLKQWRIDHFSDHNLTGYLQGIRRALEAEEGSQLSQRLDPPKARTAGELPTVPAPKGATKSSSQKV